MRRTTKRVLLFYTAITSDSCHLLLPFPFILTFENIYLFAVRYNLMIYKYYTSKFALLPSPNRENTIQHFVH